MNIAKFLELLKQLAEFSLEQEEKILSCFEQVNLSLDQLYRKERAWLAQGEVQKVLPSLLQFVRSQYETCLQKGDLNKDVIEKLFTTYQQLEEIFWSKVLHAQENKVSWALPLTPPTENMPIFSLQQISQDAHYECFSLGWGSNAFVNEQLLHIVIFLGSLFSLSLQREDTAWIGDLAHLNNKLCFERAHLVIGEIQEEIEQLFKKSRLFSSKDTARSLTKSLIALLMAGNPKNLEDLRAPKVSQAYFQDFLLYLRESIHTLQDKEQRFPEVEKSFFTHIVSRIMYVLFNHFAAEKCFIEWINHRFALNYVKTPLEVLQSLYEQIEKYFASSLPASFFLNYQKLSQSSSFCFDPFLEQKFPYPLCSIHSSSLHVNLLHMPLPLIYKEQGNREISPEFPSYIEGLQGRSHLLIYLKSSCLSLGKKDPLFLRTHLPEKCLVVDMHFPEAVSSLKEHVGEKKRLSYWIKKRHDHFLQANEELKLKRALPLERISHQAIEIICQTFFSQKEEISFVEKELFFNFYCLLITLLMLFYTDSASISFSSYDSLEETNRLSALFFTLVRGLSKQEKWKHEEIEVLIYILLRPALLARYRLLGKEELYRFSSLFSSMQELFEGKGRDTFIKLFSSYLPSVDFSKIEVKGVA